MNWSSGPITCSFAQPGSDPIILVDTSGIFYYICCANWRFSGPNLDKLLIFKSTNGGANWDGGTAFALMAPQMDGKSERSFCISKAGTRKQYLSFVSEIDRGRKREVKRIFIPIFRCCVK